MEKPATDIYTFKNLREGGFTYVDKTDIILPLVDNSIGKQFFIAQIREKDYAAPFALSQKRITLVGLGFSSEQRTVTDSAAEPL